MCCCEVYEIVGTSFFLFFSSRRRHTRCSRDWSSDVCSSDLVKNFPSELHTMAFRPWHLPPFAESEIYSEEAISPDLVTGSSFAGERRTELSDSAAGPRPLLKDVYTAVRLFEHKIGRASCRERGEVFGGGRTL